MKSIFITLVLAILSFCNGLTACEFFMYLKNYNLKGEVSKKFLVTYPKLVNQSILPLTAPVLKAVPKACIKNKCQLEIFSKAGSLYRSEYKQNMKDKSLWTPIGEFEKPIIFDQDKLDNTEFKINLMTKDEVVCSYKVKISLRD